MEDRGEPCTWGQRPVVVIEVISMSQKKGKKKKKKKKYLSN